MLHLVRDAETRAEVVEDVSDSGSTIYYERYESLVPVADFDFGEKYKLACEGCPRYGKNLSCPPHSPTFDHYINGARIAKVLCLRLPTVYFDHLIAEERYRSCFRRARSVLVRELLKHREEGYVVAGSGACLVCEQCVVETGDEHCKRPKEKIYSLESLGVNVIALVNTSFHIDLEWSADEQTADFVCAVGAVFS